MNTQSPGLVEKTFSWVGLNKRKIKHRVVREGFTEELTGQQGPEGGGGASHSDLGGKGTGGVEEG